MKQRSDAEENRAGLLAAASEVFAEYGVDAPLDLVRKQAQVGRATMYRHFPDRRSLHLALVEQSLSRFEAIEPRASDQAADLRDLLSLAADEAARSPALHAIWDKLRSDPAASPFIDRLRRTFAAPLSRAQAAGHVSKRLSIEDMFLVVRMLGAASRGTSLQTRQIEAERALSILITGIGNGMDPSLETEHVVT